MINYLTKKAYLNDITVSNLSQSFTHKMAAKTSWHRYGTKLRHCHPVYTLAVHIVLHARGAAVDKISTDVTRRADC